LDSLLCLGFVGLTLHFLQSLVWCHLEVVLLGQVWLAIENVLLLVEHHVVFLVPLVLRNQSQVRHLDLDHRMVDAVHQPQILLLQVDHIQFGIVCALVLVLSVVVQLHRPSGSVKSEVGTQPLQG
jgi:hypothetical protein